MGTINYGTSKFITIGLNPDNFEDYVDEDGKVYEGSRYELMDDVRQWIENLFEESGVKDNSAYAVKIESGYYEGFYINITDEYLYFDDEEDREEARQELENVFSFLNGAVDKGLCVVHPSWATSYLDYMQSKEELEEAYQAALIECSEKPDYKKFQTTPEYLKMFGNR